MKNITKIFFTFLTIFGSLFLAAQVKAIDFDPPEFKDKTYQAKYYNQSVNDPITIEAGSTKEVTVRFRNAGTKNWSSSGYDFVSVYTVNKKYRSSQFVGSSWLSKSNPTKLIKDTKPNEIGEFKIKLTAPQKKGEYKEDFYLAAENSTWIKGGYFYLKIKVVEATKKSTGAVVKSDYVFTKNLEVGDSSAEVTQLQTVLKQSGYYTYPQITGYYGPVTKAAVVKLQKAWGASPFPGTVGPQTRNILNSLTKKTTNNGAASKIVEKIKTEPTKVVISKDFVANLIGVTTDKVVVKGGEKIKFIAIYTNSGEKTWNNLVLSEFGSRAASVDNKDFSLADSSWQTEKKVVKISKSVAKGSAVRIPFVFRAPAKKGEYTAEFSLSADGNSLSGSSFKVVVKVVEDALASYQIPVLAKDSGARDLTEEPDIKVGLYSTTKIVQFKSPKDYDVYAGKSLKGVLPAKELAALSYSNGVYSFKSASLSFTSSDYLKIVVKDNSSYFEIPSYVRTVSYRGNKNFNAYRGNLIYKYSKTKAIPYAVNELSLDQYIAGIAEVSNGSNIEYIKSVLVAARSYAYYHINNGLPPEKRTFDVYASTIDQLYLGYNSEIIMPNIVKQQKNTFGEMVTYNSAVVTTPYFGHSDGYTRTWSEIWGGTDKPWLKSVEAKYDKGLSMYGHGVGMSNRDASFRAVKDGWDYKTILQYYYSDTKTERIY